MIVNNYFDWAIQDPGPVNAVNGYNNRGLGMIPHSAEGHWDTLQALHDFHWSRATNPDPRKRASWAATNLKDGRFVQHYPVTAQTWTSGSGYPNNNFFAFENEGVAGEPLTQAQVDNILRAGRELMDHFGWKPKRPVDDTDKTASLYEHRECVRFGSASTACPSDRIPWDVIVPALTEEDDMAERVWCFDRAQTWIVGKGGAAPVAYPIDDKVWESIYGPHTKAMSGADLDKIAVK